jgi:hypothetical protein
MEQTTVVLKREFKIPEPMYGVPGTRPRYPFDEMAVGDWFAIPSARSDLHSMAATIRRRHQRKPGALFSPRRLEGGKDIVIRVA